MNKMGFVFLRLPYTSVGTLETAFIACTGCRYCTADCPRNIPIPDFFAMYNACRRNPQENWKIQPFYQRAATDRAKASECIQCGQCESRCPQRLSHHIPFEAGFGYVRVKVWAVRMYSPFLWNR